MSDIIIRSEIEMDTKKFCLYARVSSREQEREGYSIDAQIKNCKDYALAHDLVIAKEFVDIESAKESGRKKFSEMIAYLETNKDVGIICEKVDRLCRNFKDYVTFDDLKRTIIFVKENSIITPDSRASDKFFFGIRVLMARNYIDNLSDEIKKGLYEKFAQGGYPRKAPLGYLNDKNSRSIALDSSKAPHIVKLFELYATGNYSLDGIANVLYEDGLRTRSGRKVVKSSLHRILQEPFYYGLMQFNGRTNRGKHEPLISKKLFDMANEMLDMKGRAKAVNHEFALKGRLRCATCGCAITAETQRGHVYYRCTHSRPCTERKYVREEALTEQLEKILADLELDSEGAEILIKATKEASKMELDYNLTSVESLNKQYEKVKTRLNRLVDAHLDGKIPEDMFDTKREELIKEKANIETQLESHKGAHDSTFEQLQKVVKVAQHVRKLFKVGDPKTKQILLALISSNINLSNGIIVSYQLNPLFSYLFTGLKQPENRKLSGREDLNLRPPRPKRGALAN
ncbi:MAG: Resolvase [Candidatus Curtissbacteria bacterium GW2011_GWA2_41_24]|uniref:Resolvase n=1 Tax=Candidatus Curtissbacteria bacterium GW2011_GWA2_41_24 TaxID=1618411 RepID=A0A0G0VW66_9BACT|nr:MAG: Resolvase [Candidatus Curtissbacteria bacterium GW2011_GWA2_41_24]